MARGRGGEPTDSSSAQSAPLRGLAGVAVRLANMAKMCNEKAEKLEEVAAKKRAEKQVWQQMKAEGVMLPERLILRLRSRLQTIQKSQAEKQEQFESIRTQYLAKAKQADSAYRARGINAMGLADAWQATQMYKPIMRSAEAPVSEPVQAPQEPVATQPEPVQPSEAKEPAKAKVAPSSKPQAPEYGPPPAEIAGIALPDSVERNIDRALNAEIPQLKSGADTETWDGFAQWLGEFEQWDEYQGVTREENLYKRRALGAMMSEYVRTGVAPSAREMIGLLGLCGVSSQYSAAMRLMMESPEEGGDPDRVMRALSHLAPDDPRPLADKIDAFCKELGHVQVAYYKPRGEKDAFLKPTKEEKSITDGAKLSIASAMLFALHGSDTPVYRHTMAQSAYKGFDVPKPSKNVTAGEKYVHFLGLLDTINTGMNDRDQTSHDRLAAWEALLWNVDGPKWYESSQKENSNTVFPKWDRKKLKEYFEWHRGFTKKKQAVK